MSDDWRSMKSAKPAKRDGTMILCCFIRYSDGETVVVPVCWMAPGGDESLLGWWSPGATTGTRSYDGLPFDYSPCTITPLCWKPMPPPEDAKTLRRRHGAILRWKGEA